MDEHKCIDKKAKAFTTWISLGPQRSFQEVSEKTGYPLTSIRRWAAAGRWAEKLGEQEAKVALSGVTISDILDHGMKGRLKDCLEQQINIVNALVQQFADGIRSGAIRVKSIKDFEILVNLHMRLSQGMRSGDAVRDAAAMLHMPAMLKHGDSDIEVSEADYDDNQ